MNRDSLPTSWRDVFDCKKYFGHIDIMLEVVEKTGYKFFVWNGEICRFNGVKDGRLTFSKTPLTVEDLK